jgi:hypothetical protein
MPYPREASSLTRMLDMSFVNKELPKDAINVLIAPYFEGKNSLVSSYLLFIKKGTLKILAN